MPSALLAQHTYIPLGGISQHIIDRMEIKGGELNNSFFHTTTKSYRRQAIACYSDTFYPVNKVSLSSRDYFNLSYLVTDNFEWSKNEIVNSKRKFGKNAYQKKAAMFYGKAEDFNLIVNPVLYYEVSSEKFGSSNVLLNNRGIEIRGNVGKNIGFYTQVNDEILKPYPWVADRVARENTLLYVNSFKGINNTYNYFLSNAYISANLNKYMDLQFGNTRNFIGDGYRTFILGDNQPEYLNLRLNTRVWKMNYTNIWAELRDPIYGSYAIQPRHYMATHHLSLNVSKNLNIGMFETILFNRDSGYANGGYELNYLNPVVFYKSIENGLNSTDKAIIGVNYKYNFLKHFSLFGQVVISEFVLKELLARTGWWGNKWATQVGIKYIDVAGISNLDLHLELNVCRPYMYTSFSSAQTFSNFNQPMAHPLGANFFEYIGVINYQPFNRLFLKSKIILANYGNDVDSSNYGKNIILSYDSRNKNYGNTIGQGVKTQLLIGDIQLSFMAKHNLFFDLKFGYRKTTSDLPQFASSSVYFTGGIRLNIAYRNYDF